MGTDQSAGLPEEVVESVSPAFIRAGFRYIGSVCCGKMILANCNGIIVGACPDHAPIVVTSGEIIYLEAMLHG